ncbi:hypothetical protein LguiB_011522 [Lonicera macranthoides]
MMALDKESVESTWSCITTNSNFVQDQPQSPFQSPNTVGSSIRVVGLNNYSPQQQQQNRKFSPRNRVEEEETCYICRKLGHGTTDCPKTTTTTSPPPQHAEPSTPQPVILGLGGSHSQCEPRVVCNKCGGIAKTQTSKSVMNPGREYFKCIDNKCFVNWVNEVGTKDIIYVPICKCKAGFCRLSTNAGRNCLVCPIKKGQGACDFLQWLDDTPPVIPINGHATNERISTSPHSTVTNCDDNSPASSSDLVHQGHCSSHNEMGIESTPVAVVNTPPHDPQNTPHGSVSSGQMKRSIKTITFDSDGKEEDHSTETLRKHHKRFRHGGPKFVLDFDTEYLDTPTEPLSKEEELQAAMILRSEAEIDRGRQIIRGFSGPCASFESGASTLDSNSMPLRENCLLTAAMDRNLGVFPSFNPISVPQNADNASSLCSGKDSQLSSVVRWEPSRVLGSSVMSDAIFKSFGRAAMELQNELLALLESMDFHNHKSMAEEANTTFDALDQLSMNFPNSMNFLHFRERVMEFINRASSLAELERSVSNDHSSKELVEWYNREKSWLDDVSRDHAKTIAELDASKQRIKLLDEKAASIRDMLFEIEADLVCYRAENQDLESKLVKISKAKAESEFASEAAGGALKIYQQREEDLHRAEAAFKKAKILLRQQ